jgi:hypothetical protein
VAPPTKNTITIGFDLPLAFLPVKIVL